MNPKRPRTHSGGTCVYPSDADLIAMFGGERIDGVTWTIDQVRALETLYGFNVAASVAEAVAYAEQAHAAEVAARAERNAKRDRWQAQEPPVPPVDRAGIANMQRAGDLLSLSRRARVDGLRLIAAIAPHLDPGADPVRLLCRLLADAGYDLTEDPDWYEETP